MSELPPPPDAPQDPDAVELLRAWIVGASLHCVLQPNVFEESGPWGEVLADVVDHLAQARQQFDGTAPADTIRRIRDVFEEEIRALLDEQGGQPAE